MRGCDKTGLWITISGEMIGENQNTTEREFRVRKESDETSRVRELTGGWRCGERTEEMGPWWRSWRRGDKVIVGGGPLDDVIIA